MNGLRGHMERGTLFSSRRSKKMHHLSLPPLSRRQMLAYHHEKRLSRGRLMASVTLSICAPTINEPARAIAGAHDVSAIINDRMTTLALHEHALFM